jgi:hypothetical protein
MQDSITRKNQIEACRLTGGLVPHPNFKPLYSWNGLPLGSPFQVALCGRPANSAVSAPDQPTSTYVPPSIQAAPQMPDTLETTYDDFAYSSDWSSDYATYYSGGKRSWFARKIGWIAGHVWPFPQLEALGDNLTYGNFNTRLIIACAGGFALFLGTFGHSTFWSWTAFAIGAVFGYILTPAIGKVLLFTNRCLVFTVCLAICVVVGGVTYAALSLIVSAASSNHVQPNSLSQQSTMRAELPQRSSQLKHRHRATTGMAGKVSNTVRVPTSSEVVQEIMKKGYSPVLPH